MINKLFSLSIKTKITITIFFVILFFSLGVIFVIKNSLSLKVNSLAVNTTKDIVSINEALIIKSLLEDDIWSIYKFLNSLTKINLIKSAGFVDNTNTIIAHTNTDKYPINKEIKKIEKKDLIYLPLISNDINLGYFIIKIDKISMSMIFDDFKSHLLIFIIFATFFSFLIAYIISTRILNRLNILSYNAKMIQNKNYEKVKSIDSKEQDEITLFQNSMELILNQLNNSIDNEKSLRKFYHNILESLDELIILYDKNLNIMYDNSHELNKLLIKNEEIKKKTLKLIKQNINQNSNNFVFDIENSEGKTIYLFVLIKEFKDSYAISFSDITILKFLQEKQCLTSSFEVVGEISSSVVHEIKNYLQPAKLLMEQDEIDYEDKKRVQNIISKIDYLVNDFLKTGRPIDKLLSEKINTYDRINHILFILKSQIETKNLKVKKSINKNIVLFMASNDLDTIIINLIENAIDESKNNSEIHINSYLEKNYVTIEVTDFGKGINKDTLKNIYKPFFTTKGENGTGIGLYTTYKIVYMYGGYIDVKSKVGKTTFSINIPIKEDNEYSNN